MLNTLLSSFYFWFLFLFLILFPFFLPLWIRISFHNLRKDNSVTLELEIKLFNKLRLFLLIKTISPLISDERIKYILRYLPRVREIVHRRKIYRVSILKYYHLFYRFAFSFSWQRMDIFCKIGTGDPAATGIITGSLRFLASVISSRIYNSLHFRVNKPRIFMFPSFVKKEFIFFTSFEFNTSGARILLFLLLLVWIFIKEISKNFWRWVINGGSSYSRFNDHSDGKFKRDG